jgi:hypothetical protein
MARSLWRALAAFLFLSNPGQSCTTIVAGKLATADGSVMAAHSNDGDGGFNGNLVRVAAADWPSGAVRPPGIPQVNHTFGYLRVSLLKFFAAATPLCDPSLR